MGLFKNQLANVVEWEEYRDDVIFYKWNNSEIKKGSRLIIRPGQDAIFLYNGVTEGVFEKEGNYDIESDIMPFLSTLKGFKFGFNSGIRAEVIFINTKEFTMKWGTKQAVNLPTPALPGGMPIRANGTFQFKVGSYQMLIDKVAGIKKQYTTEEVRERVLSVLNQLLLRWIVREGKDMFNIQANAVEISEGIMGELNTELEKIGLAATGFQIDSVSYPEEVQEMIDAMTNTSNNGGGNNMAADMASMQMGMMMGQQMVNQMQNAMQGQNNQNIAQGQVQNTASNVQPQSQPQPQAEQPAGAEISRLRIVAISLSNFGICPIFANSSANILT